MPRKSERELRRMIEDLKSDGVGEFRISSNVVTITEDMTDETGAVADNIDTPEDVEILPTESNVVTVWSNWMD